MTSIAFDFLSLIAAVLLAGGGGELFLKGVLGAASALRVPKLLVATSLAAFATSAPELTVSSIAALAGEPEIGLGDALGSNVVNVALLFGLALLFGPIRASRAELGRDFVLALGVPLLTLLLVADGALTRIEGGLLLLLFAIWISLLVRQGLVWRDAEQRPDGASLTEAPPTPWRAAFFGVAGLAALVLAGRLFVHSATALAGLFAVDAYIVGVIVVAVGTSLPELVTVLLARLRGHDDIGVGTLLGSNLFNGLAVVGVAASIHPVHVPLAEVAPALALGVVALLLMVPPADGLIRRRRGLVLLAVYGLFLGITLSAARFA